MDSNDEDGILLNLTKNTEEQPNYVGIKKITTRNFSQKNPRHVKNLTHTSAKCKKSDVHKDKISQDEDCKKFQVISSLFRKNPDLPDISSSVSQSGDMEKDKTFCGSEFGNMDLAPYMISNLEKNLCLKKMTSVQKASLPLLLSGKDVFVKSPTGTGKTLAYVIPVVQSLQAISPKVQRSHGPYCLILVPTRELANQTLTVVQQVLKPFIWIVPGSVTGGEKRKSEKARLRKGVNILVATPGRLVDHLKTTKCLKMEQLKWLILDEADRLLDLGFEQDLSFIMSAIKDHSAQKLQKVLISATLSQGIENLRDVSMENAVTIDMTKEGNSEPEQMEYHTPSLLEQFCVVVPMKLRLVTLTAFLQQKYQKNCKIIVFLTTQDSVDFHFLLYTSNLKTVKGLQLEFMKLHGRLSQNERGQVFSKFKESAQAVLLCTDVAARGLDLPSVDWIVQYNPPVSSTDYVHRVGRTARIGMSGKALLFLLPTEVPYLNILSERNLRVKELKIEDILTEFVRSRCAEKTTISEEHLQDVLTKQHLKFEECVLQNKSLKELAVIAFRSFIGAYNTFPSSLKHVFHSRKLHLGHLAKSFALRETPGELKQKFPRGERMQVHGDKVKRSSRKHAPNFAMGEPLTKKLKR